MRRVRAKATALNPCSPSYNKFSSLHVDICNSKDSNVPVLSPASSVSLSSTCMLSSYSSRTRSDLYRRVQFAPIVSDIPVAFASSVSLRDSTPMVSEANSTLLLPFIYDSVSSCQVSEERPGTSHFHIQARLNSDPVRAMLGSRATSLFINQHYMSRKGISTHHLTRTFALQYRWNKESRRNH